MKKLNKILKMSLVSTLGIMNSVIENTGTDIGSAEKIVIGRVSSKKGKKYNIKYEAEYNIILSKWIFRGGNLTLNSKFNYSNIKLSKDEWLLFFLKGTDGNEYNTIDSIECCFIISKLEINTNCMNKLDGFEVKPHSDLITESVKKTIESIEAWFD
jgi:hypothetical protein